MYVHTVQIGHFLPTTTLKLSKSLLLHYNYHYHFITVDLLLRNDVALFKLEKIV